MQVGVGNWTDLRIHGLVRCKGKEKSIGKLLLRHQFGCSETHDGHTHSISSQASLFLFQGRISAVTFYRFVCWFVSGRQHAESFLCNQYNVPVDWFISRCQIGKGAARRHQWMYRTLHQRRQGKRIDPSNHSTFLKI